MPAKNPIKIRISGSKSLTNRILALSAFGEGKTIISNFGHCDDTNFMLAGLRKLGLKITKKGDKIEVEGRGGVLPHQKKTIKIYTGNAGTATRFLTAIATLSPNTVIIEGNARMNQRPILELTKALNSLGANIETTNGCTPITIHPQKPKGGEVKINGSISSQYISALLMLGAKTEKGITLKIDQKLCSKPYVAMTLENIAQFKGKTVNKNFEQTSSLPSSLKANKVTIEPDSSSASYMGAFGALNPLLQIELLNVSRKSLQGDIKFLDYLKKMGCEIKEKKNSVVIQGPKKLKPLGTIDMNETPDLVMTFAILAIFTEGKTKITNIENLRIKESDRIKALEQELKKLGIKTKSGKSFLEITGNPLITKELSEKKISIHCYDDHRIAMAFGLILNKFQNLKIEDKACVNKSYQNYWKDLELVSKPKEVIKKVVLVGLRGSGKSTLGKILAKKLKLQFLDLDDEVERNAKQKISEIVAKKGWTHFRKLESREVAKLKKKKKILCAAGGGALLSPINTKNLKDESLVIYLHRLPEDCLKKIAKDPNRPRLTKAKTPLKELQETYKKRHPLYLESCDIMLNRENNLEKDAKKIINFLKWKRISL